MRFSSIFDSFHSPRPDVISIEPSEDDSSFDDCFPRTPVILTKPLLQWDWQAVTIKKKHPGSHFYQGRINSRNILEVCEHSAFKTNFLKISMVVEEIGCILTISCLLLAQRKHLQVFGGKIIIFHHPKEVSIQPVEFFHFAFLPFPFHLPGFNELSGTRLGLSDNSIQNTREEIIPNKMISANDLKCGVEMEGGSWLENLPNFVANFP